MSDIIDLESARRRLTELDRERANKGSQDDHRATGAIDMVRSRVAALFRDEDEA